MPVPSLGTTVTRMAAQAGATVIGVSRTPSNLEEHLGPLVAQGLSVIPVAADVPEAFNVQLFDNANLKPTPNRSKATGEPPLMTALSVFFALKDAVSASANHAVPVLLDAPATPERLLLACERARAAA